MVARPVGPGDQVARIGDQVIHHDRHTLQADRRSVTRLSPHVPDFRFGSRPDGFGVQDSLQLDFVQIHVTAYDSEHKAVAFTLDVGHQEEGLGGARLGDLQEPGQVGDGLAVRRFHVLHGQHIFVGRRRLSGASDALIDAVPASVAHHDCLLTQF